MVELSPLADALVVAGVIEDPLAAAAEPPPAHSVILYTTREDWANIAAEVQQLANKFSALKVQLLPDGPLPWLARHLAEAEPVNLLQGEFARASDYSMQWRPWRSAALLAAALFMVHVGAQALQLRRAGHENADLDAKMTQVFTSTLPSEPLRDPRRQMQSRLDRIHMSGAGPQYFLRTLQAVSGALAAAPKTTIDSLSYRDQSLDMKVSAPDLAALSQLSRQVAKFGLSADIQSSNPVAGGVEAHVQIRTQGTRSARP